MFACGLLWIFKPFSTSKARWCWLNEGTSRLCLFKISSFRKLSMLLKCSLNSVWTMDSQQYGTLKSLHYCKTGVLSRYSYTISFVLLVLYQKTFSSMVTMLLKLLFSHLFSEESAYGTTCLKSIPSCIFVFQ